MSIERGQVEVALDITSGCHHCDSFLDAHRAAFDETNEHVARTMLNRDDSPDGVEELVDVMVEVYCGGGDPRWKHLGKKVCYAISIPHINVRQTAPNLND